MEKNKHGKEVEKNTLKPIAMEDRMSWLSIAFIQAGICVCVPSFLLGAILAESMDFWPAVISGALGYVIVVIIMTILGALGSDLGVPTVVTTQSGMGVLGTRFIVSAVFGLNLIGWFGINNAVAGEAFANLLGDTYGINIPGPLSSVIWGIIMLSTAIFGMKAMEKLDKIAVPLLMIIMSAGTYIALNQYGWEGIFGEVDATMSFLAGVGLSFNFYAVGAITPGDISRYQESRVNVFKSAALGVFPLGVITLVLGIIMTKVAGEYDISMVLIGIGIPLLGITSLILSTWTTNAFNAYAAALSVTKIFNVPDDRRRELTLVVGILGIALGAFGILDYLQGILSMLACIATPIGGVLLADYWIIGKGKPENWHAVKGFNWAGVIAWAIGATVAYILYIEYSGILIAMVVYLILEKFMPSPSRGNGVAEHRIDWEREKEVLKIPGRKL